MGSPIPIVATTSGDAADAPPGAIPVALYSGSTAGNAVLDALIAAGFGTAGQVLTTNATADGFEWTTPV